MNNAIGARAWEGLRINFGSCFFLKSNEPEVEFHARTILGKKDGETSVRMKMEGTDSSSGGVTTASESKRKVSIAGESHIIQEGALARLDSHEGFYTISDGQICESRVFLLPVFEKAEPSETSAAGNLLDFAAAMFRYNAACSNDPTERYLAEKANLPGVSLENFSGSPLPLPLGSNCFLDVIRLSAACGQIMRGKARNAKLTIKEKVQGFQSLPFAELLRIMGSEENLARKSGETFRAAGEAMIAFSEAFKSHAAGRKISRSKLSHEARGLYQVLGIQVPAAAQSTSDLANRDSKLLCTAATNLDLSDIPEVFFVRDTVHFFSVLNDPFYRSVLPKLILVTVHEDLPMAVFDPELVTRENAILVAAVTVCFANCFGPRAGTLSLT